MQLTICLRVIRNAWHFYYALIPADHEGVEIGERHDPLGSAFMNGPTRGEDRSEERRVGKECC